MCRRPAWVRLILRPEPLILKRLATPFFVFRRAMGLGIGRGTVARVGRLTTGFWREVARAGARNDEVRMPTVDGQAAKAHGSQDPAVFDVFNSGDPCFLRDPI